MFTDIHCHLLHGVDDGPRDEAGSLAVARLLVAHGFGAVVATPHALPQFADGAKVPAFARELRLDESFMEAELAGKGRHLCGTSYTLVEAPYDTVVNALPDLLFRLRRKGVQPVLAHPERCAHFHQAGQAEEAVRLGAHLQLDLGSLAGAYGRLARKTALKLLEAGLYAVAASDLHEADDSPKWLAQGLRELEKRLGGAGLKRLLDENPARLVRNEELS